MLRKFSLSLINFYQKYIRIGVPSCCRFTPNCSEYAKQAIEKHGFAGGVLRATKRLLRCHPFSGKSGHDPLI